MNSDKGIRLEYDDQQPDLHSLEDINAVLLPIGAKLWRQDWTGLSGDLKDFLADPDPSPERVADDT